MTNNTHPQSTARIETFPAVTAGDVITHAGTEYYVDEVRRSTLKLLRLPGLGSGYSLPIAAVRSGRKATEEEQNRVYAKKVAQIEAEAALCPGALVRVTKASKHADPNALYVILKDNAKTVTITELGGGSHGLNAPRSLLAVVDPADVLK